MQVTWALGHDSHGRAVLKKLGSVQDKSQSPWVGSVVWMWRIRAKRLRWGGGWGNWRNKHVGGRIMHSTVFSSLRVWGITAGVAGLALSERYPCPEGPPPSHIHLRSACHRDYPPCVSSGWICHFGHSRVPLLPIAHIYVPKSQALSLLTSPSPGLPEKVNHLSRH